MRNGIAAAVLMAVVVAAVGLDATAKDARKGGSAVFVPASDIKWSDVPGFAGVQLAVVEGDPAKGAHHSMIKFTPGFKAPLHHHSSDHHGTVVAGTLVLTVDGQEHKLPVGSYFSFTGKSKHMTACEAGAECILSMDVRGKWDVVPAETKQAKR